MSEQAKPINISRPFPIWGVVFMLFVVVVLLCIGGSCMALSSRHGTRSATAAHPTSTVTPSPTVKPVESLVFTVEGTGVASFISYSKDGGTNNYQDQPLPWRLEIAVPGIFQTVSLTAMAGGDPQSMVTCSIFRGTRLIRSGTGSGAYGTCVVSY